MPPSGMQRRINASEVGGSIECYTIATNKTPEQLGSGESEHVWAEGYGSPE